MRNDKKDPCCVHVKCKESRKRRRRRKNLNMEFRTLAPFFCKNVIRKIQNHLPDIWLPISFLLRELEKTFNLNENAGPSQASSEVGVPRAMALLKVFL